MGISGASGDCMGKSSKKRSKPAGAMMAPAAPYVPTPQERQGVLELLERLDQAKPLATAKVEMKQACAHVSWDHPDQNIARVLWANSLGTSDMVFSATVLQQLAQLVNTGSELSATKLNAMLALVRGLAPNDPTESLLVAQMAAVHTASMNAAQRLAHAHSPELQDSAVRAVTKLTRTFAAQVEALKNYRRKGEQTITVQHVTVNDGGQAIVGDVQHAPISGGPLKTERQSDVLSHTTAPGAALHGDVQADGQPLPSPGGAGKTGVPLPRRASRSAEGHRQRRLPARQLDQRGDTAATSRRPAAP
jgi:hypothetical protein